MSMSLLDVNNRSHGIVGACLILANDLIQPPHIYHFSIDALGQLGTSLYNNGLIVYSKLVTETMST